MTRAFITVSLRAEGELAKADQQRGFELVLTVTALPRRRLSYRGRRESP